MLFAFVSLCGVNDAAGGLLLLLHFTSTYCLLQPQSKESSAFTMPSQGMPPHNPVSPDEVDQNRWKRLFCHHNIPATVPTGVSNSNTLCPLLEHHTQP
jgi:hypothetical protein